MGHRWPVVTGDRVALAPHTDLWMMGIRFATVESIRKTPGKGKRYVLTYPEADGDTRTVWLDRDDLLGAVGAMPSTDNPDSIGAGWPEEGLSDEPNEYGFICAEFDEDGSCIHSEHMMAAGL